MPQTTDPDNLHEDVPFDERNGASSPRLKHRWCRNLPRTSPTCFFSVSPILVSHGDATNNPYITVDAMTMDLTVFNGEDDLRKLIDRDGDGTVAEPVDPFTPAYPTQLAFDTRREDSRTQL